MTIRYSPSKFTLIDPAEEKNLKNELSDPNGLKTEKSLSTFLKKITDYKDTICVSLSGGIDSTLALALLRKTFPDKKILSICGVFENGFDESIDAKKIADNFNSNFKIVKMSSVFTNMPEIISISQKPKWNTYSHLISKEAKKHSKLLITGDGADEIFGGYTFRYSKFLNLFRSTDNWKIKTINYLECHNRDWVPDQEQLFGSSIKFDWNAIYQYFKPFFSSRLEPIKQVFWADFNGKLLFDFIPTSEKISKYHKIDIHSPFLNSDTISLGLKLPISQKYNLKTNQGKLTLRKISKRLGVKHIEEKRGFSPSLFYDWEKNGRDICKEYIYNKKSYIYQKKLINLNWVIRAFEKVDNDGDIRYLNRLISILALEIWYRVFISKEIKPLTKL